MALSPVTGWRCLRSLAFEMRAATHEVSISGCRSGPLTRVQSRMVYAAAVHDEENESVLCRFATVTRFDSTRPCCGFATRRTPQASKKEIKDILMAYDRTLLVADPRRCEPKKFGGTGARARFQKSYR